MGNTRNTLFERAYFTDQLTIKSSDMKKIYSLIVLTMAASAIYAQSHNCCAAVGQFANFSQDVAFVQTHADPIPFQLTGQLGSMQTFACKDSTTASAYMIKAEQASNKYVLVFHEWWGLNDYIKQTSDQLYTDLGKQVHVIAVDLYDGKVAAKKDSASKYMQQLSYDRASMIINSLIDKFGDDVEIATIGWCMGGGYSLQASLMAKERAIGCVMYYGFPETDKAKIAGLASDVLMIWPNQDKWITKEVVDKFKTDMEEADKSLQVVEFNADHAFANPSNPKYDITLATDANFIALTFLKQHLKIAE